MGLEPHRFSMCLEHPDPDKSGSTNLNMESNSTLAAVRTSVNPDQVELIAWSDSGWGFRQKLGRGRARSP